MARVPYVDQDDLDSEYQDLIISSLQPGKRVNVYSAIGNNQEVLGGLRDFLGSLWEHSGLTDRQREIIILTTSSEVSSSFEWHQHINIATDSGLNEEEISAIARDDRNLFTTEEQILVAYTRAVVRGRVQDTLHDAAATYFDEEILVGASATAAGYLALGRIIDALDVEIEAEEEFRGWDLIDE